NPYSDPKAGKYVVISTWRAPDYLGPAASDRHVPSLCRAGGPRGFTRGHQNPRSHSCPRSKSGTPVHSTGLHGTRFHDPHQDSNPGRVMVYSRLERGLRCNSEAFLFPPCSPRARHEVGGGRCGSDRICHPLNTQKSKDLTNSDLRLPLEHEVWSFDRRTV